jgi:glutathione synthase/RimK-type ligase-like ATP-grasp enzyme
VLNPPAKISLAANKLLSFQALAAANVPIPAFAADRSSVSWEGTTVVRHKLTGHSGEGIEIVEPGTELPAAPLYVEYVKKEDEYRVHIIGESITTVQRKARDKSNENPNWQVRNHANGFVFVREGVDPPACVRDAATGAIAALGLDFGAVDVIYNRKSGKAYVLEVNTAPGMEGTTIQEYADGFRALLEGA